MAITKCRECGSKISSSASACPVCGAKPRRMGLGTALILIAVTAVIISAINNTIVDSRQRAQQAQMKASADARSTAFLAQRDAIAAAVKVDVEKNDIAAAEAALKPWATTSDPSLDVLRKVVGERRQQIDAIAAKAALVAQASLIKRDDWDDGARIYTGLLKAEPDNKTYAAELARYTAGKAKHDEVVYRATRIRLRKELALKTEAMFLKNGYSVTVTTEGAEKATMRFKYILANKAFAYQMQTNNDFMGGLRAAGFKKLIIDGYDSYWTVEP